MALKKKPPPAGAPEWVLTYGDMMSLLLCFFILLAAFADFEKGGASIRTVEAIASIQEALGVRTSGTVLDRKIEFNSLIDQLKQTIRELQTKAQGNSAEEGLKGKTFRLRKMRDGMEIVVGGPILFELYASDLSPAGREALVQIGKILKGHRNMVEIRGHAGDIAASAENAYQEAMRLSHARAEAAALELIQGGIDPRTLRLVAVGANEPVSREANGRDYRTDSRRVEIVVRESLMDDFN